MIDCKECVEYAHSVLARGEIQVEDINKLAIDRHVLKGCDSGQTIGFWGSSKVPMDIVVNGFSIKQTILEVLNKYNIGHSMDFSYDELGEIAKEIKEAFAIKLKLKQGEIKSFEGCNHESDGLIYNSNPPQNKCKKCGEFYR
jgi:hypothetical protein